MDLPLDIVIKIAIFIAWECPFDLLGFLQIRDDTQELFVLEKNWSDPDHFELLSRSLWQIALASMENISLDHMNQLYDPLFDYRDRVIQITIYGHPLLQAGASEGQVMGEINQMDQQEIIDWNQCLVKNIWPIPDDLRREWDEIERELLEMEEEEKES